MLKACEVINNESWRMFTKLGNEMRNKSQVFLSVFVHHHHYHHHIKLFLMCQSFLVFISLIRMRSKRDIKMGRLCTPGGAVLGIVGGGVTFRFSNGEAILDENMLFWVRLYALVVVLKILLDFRL